MFCVANQTLSSSCASCLALRESASPGRVSGLFVVADFETSRRQMGWSAHLSAISSFRQCPVWGTTAQHSVDQATTAWIHQHLSIPEGCIPSVWLHRLSRAHQSARSAFDRTFSRWGQYSMYSGSKLFRPKRLRQLFAWLFVLVDCDETSPGVHHHRGYVWRTVQSSKEQNAGNLLRIDSVGSMQASTQFFSSSGKILNL